MMKDHDTSAAGDSVTVGEDVSRRKALEKLALYSALAAPTLTVLLKPREGQADSGSGGGDDI